VVAVVFFVANSLAQVFIGFLLVNLAFILSRFLLLNALRACCRGNVVGVPLLFLMVLACVLSHILWLKVLSLLGDFLLLHKAEFNAFAFKCVDDVQCFASLFKFKLSRRDHLTYFTDKDFFTNLA
jgi:hypothetical protein